MTKVNKIPILALTQSSKRFCIPCIKAKKEQNKYVISMIMWDSYHSETVTVAIVFNRDMATVNLAKTN